MELFGGIEWRTGTYLDSYTPIYLALLKMGISQHDADRMDITMVALMLGVPAGVATVDDDAPVLRPDGERMPATTPPGIKRPRWWRGDKAAFDSSQRAGSELQRHQGSMGGGGP